MHAHSTNGNSCIHQVVTSDKANAFIHRFCHVNKLFTSLWNMCGIWNEYFIQHQVGPNKHIQVI